MRLWGLALALLPAAGWAQDACELIGAEEFATLTGRAVFAETELVEVAGGTLCSHENGQVYLFPGPDAEAAWEDLLAVFGLDGLARTPLYGLGDSAYAILSPADAAAWDMALVAFVKGGRLAAVSVDAETEDAGEAAMGQTIAVARIIAGRIE